MDKMLKRFTLAVGCAALLLFVAACAGAAVPGNLVWSASTDWRQDSSANTNLRNPNGDWVYAEADRPGGEITRLWSCATSADGNWSGFHSYWNRNLAGKNISRTAIYRLPADGGAWLKPGQIALYPGLDRTQNLAMLRWTAPCHATVRLYAAFTGNHIPTDDKDPGTVSQAMVLRNGAVLWSAPIDGFVGCSIDGKEYPRTGTSPSQVYSKEVEVGEGDTIDFACDFSKTPGLTSGSMWDGLTGVDAQVELVRILPPVKPSRPVKGWVNALKPKGTPGPELTLSTNGRPNYVILLPSKPTTQEQKAASELRLWLGKMTGADFAVKCETRLTSPLGKGGQRGVISLGRTDLEQRANLPESSADLGDEGYAISVSGNNLFLYGGRRRGPMNAVYALLEEDLGCRWYDSYSSDIPTSETLKFRPVPRHYSPPLQIRNPRIWDAFDTNWSLRNRTNSPEVIVPGEWGGSVDCALLGPAPNHSEPQLCLTDPDVLKAAVEQVKDCLGKNPHSEIISIPYIESTPSCQCARCKAINDAEGTQAGTLIKFCNSVSDAIKDEFPDVKISVAVPQDALTPPKTIRPNKNVVIQLRAPVHSWGLPFHPLTDPSDFKNAVEAWGAIGAQIDVRDSTADVNYYSCPMPNMPVLDYAIDFYAGNGADGITLDGPNESPGGDNAALRAWVWAKKLWDPSLDSKESMRDFIFGYYKEAAQPVWDYNMMLWKMWEDNGGIRQDPGKPVLFASWYAPEEKFLGKDFVVNALPLLDRAEKLAGSPQIRRRVALAKFPVLYAYLCQKIGLFLPRRKSIREFIANHIPSSEWEEIGSRLDEWEAIGKIEDVTSTSSGRIDFDEYSKRWDAVGRSDIRNSGVYLLSSVWKYKPDPQSTGVKEKWFAPEMDDSAWTDVQTQVGDVYDKDSSFRGYTGTLWYRHRFTVPNEFMSSRKVYLHFVAVDDQTEVYVNGKKAFEHTVQATHKWITGLRGAPFDFDVKPFLRPGENIVALRVRSDSVKTGGIWNPASLIVTDLKPDPIVLREVVRKGWKQWELWPQVDVKRTKVSALSGEWKFKTDPDDAGVKEKWFDAQVDDSTWATVRGDLGTGYDSQGFPGYVGLSWYRQQFRVPAEMDSSKKIYLYFGCVDEQAEVYINGKKAFDHTTASAKTPLEILYNTPFVFDIKPYLLPGRNTVAVRVTNQYGMGGIWKPAFLVTTDLKPDARVIEVAIHKLQKHY